MDYGNKNEVSLVTITDCMLDNPITRKCKISEEPIFLTSLKSAITFVK